jgi:DnaJ-class molecular chaperone
MAKKSLDEKQCYLILGVSHQVSLDELKKSYHQLATIYHPDKPTGNEEKFKEINIAYELLREALEKKQNINQFKANANDFQAKQEQSKAQQSQTSPKTQEKADHKNAWHTWREKHGFADFQQKQAASQADQIKASTYSQADPSKAQQQAQQSNQKNHEPNDQPSGNVNQNEATIELESAPEPSLAEALFDAQQKLSHHLSSLKNKGQAYLEKLTRGFYEKGKDEYLKLSIDIPTLLNGGLKKIAIQRWVICPQCQGNRQTACGICGNQGRIKNREELELQIPAGLEQGEKIKVADKGGEGLNGQKNGDLYLIAQIEGLEKYGRHGLDLELQVGIPKKLLLSGGAVMIQLLRGSFKLNIPPNSFDKRKLRISQQGLSNHDQSKIGDLIIILRSVS